MRTMLAATLMIASATGLAAAQTAPPSGAVPAVKPKPVATTPVRPALQTPAETAQAMTPAERQAIQSDLAWTGDYNGVINGEPSERMVTAIKAFQKNHGGKQTGVLNPQERAQLTEAARKLQGNVGWKLISDMVTGARLGIPAKLVPQQTSDANGSKWASSTGTIQIVLARRKEAGITIAKLADQEKKEPGRKVGYSAIKPDFFVLSGTQGLKKFYMRGAFKDSEVRILTILYDQATEGTMEPVVVAMSSAFNPFPSGALAGPPPRKKVEYSTGTIVSDDGAILADRDAVEACQSIVIAGQIAAHGNADLAATDKAHDLALLRIYGARGLKPLALGSGAAKASVDVVGIADPQNQGGGSAVSVSKAGVTPVGSNGGLALAPAPGLGFSGAPARDADGRFAGLALLRPSVVAGATNGAVAPQAALVDAETVRKFLVSNAIKPATDAPADAKASVVRVICVRK
ncbi:Peptidoglycan-binding domain 1 [Rhodopseudomonas palustris HaA2]|uniref:Peptidoglycan-binding domain 1 n=1 Tax=Rhodopseudomonas palustris (strain HaA2) TaxID=316058 RepID=Q2J2I1_RHOP2|nr:serine protease [Rhodopseudomonas palustris]ABD05329.1 Peptidoglycan-binding domain 1 [Rhodopseudomonas palustris HaA2]